MGILTPAGPGPGPIAPFALLALLSSTGCLEESETPQPDPPSVADLQGAYGAQTGTLSPETAPELTERLVRRAAEVSENLALALQLVEQASTWGALGGERQQGLTGQRTQALKTGQVQQAQTFQAGGWGRLTRLCEAVGDERGEMRISNVFDLQGGLGELFWGTLSDCQLTLDGVSRRFDGDLRLLMRLADLGTERQNVILDFTGQYIEALEDGPRTVTSGIQLQVLHDRVQIHERLEDGSTFLVGLAFEQSQGLAITVQDTLGTWGCRLTEDLTGGACDREGADGRVDW